MLAQGLFTNRTTKTTDPFVSETTMRYIRLTAIACAVFIYPSVQANAQEADAPSEAGPDAATPAPTATAPRLLHAVEPDYPEAQRKQGRAASVGLVLIIDTEGRVTEATISDSAGDDFDRHASFPERGQSPRNPGSDCVGFPCPLLAGSPDTSKVGHEAAKLKAGQRRNFLRQHHG